MLRTTTDDARGFLRPTVSSAPFQLARYEPSAALQPFVERYWVIRWALGKGESRVQEVLTYPCIDIVFQRGTARVWGVLTRRLRRRFVGAGVVLGVKFRPGGFKAFTEMPLVGFTDRSRAADAVLRFPSGTAARSVATTLPHCSDDGERVRIVERLLLACRPQREPNVEIVSRAVHAALHDRRLVRVADLAESLSVSPRALERLFRTYVGVSPKWVLTQFRAMRAVERAQMPGAIDWAGTAADLGYADQSHLTNDFRSRVGVTPARYVSRGRRAV